MVVSGFSAVWRDGAVELTWSTSFELDHRGFLAAVIAAMHDPETAGVVALEGQAEPARPDEFVLPTVIDVIEPTGAEDLVSLQFGSLRIQSKMRDAASWSTGDRVTAAFSLEKTKFFSEETGLRIPTKLALAA